MRVLVTGATGVIGSRAVALLLREGHSVTALGRSAEKLAVLERQGAAASRVSLFDREALRGAAAGCDTILNLATHMPSSMLRIMLPGAWDENDRVRRAGSSNLVDAAIGAGVRRFVQESFAPTYPDCGERWIDEETPLRPVVYNRTIVDAEASAARFARGAGVSVVLRFGDFYGPDSRFLREMLGIVRRGWAPMPGPERFLSSVSHDDAAAAAVAALELDGGTYNVVDDEPVTRRVFFDTLAASLGASPPKFPPLWTARLFGSIGELMSRSQRMSNRKIREKSGWSPRYRSIREGLPETVREMLASERQAA